MPLESVAQPFLRGAGTVLGISGAGINPTRLQSFEYESAQGAAADAATFGPDGSPRGVLVDWLAAPRLYLKGRVLVIYVGADAAVTGLLTTSSALGSRVGELGSSELSSQVAWTGWRLPAG